MNVIEQMRSVAAAENEAARATWDELDFYKPSRRDLVRQYVGSGMTQKQVGELVGMSQRGVSKTLKKNGWKL